MLHYKAIDTPALELLKKLQASNIFSGLRLVGGTSLALQIGHRKSIDPYLFGNLKSDFISVLNEFNKLGKTTQLKKTENINTYLINTIKVDIVNYPYEWIDHPLIENGLMLAGKKDIAAMKLSAISGRGTKKDFIDIYYLLQHYTLNELLGFYSEKYHDGSVFLVLKSLLYFDDADKDESPLMLKPVDWKEIKKYITLIIERHTKIN